MINTIELNKNKPWYRFPFVWMMFAIPFSAVIMGAVMIWLAVDTDDGLVADDYYKQGLAINRVLSRDKKAAELNLRAIIKFDSGTKVINLQFDKGTLESFPQDLQLHLQHATRENSDVMVWLDHGIDDQYIGHVKQAISEGVWYFEISDKGKADAGWKLNARTHVHSNNIIHMQSDY